MDAPNLSLAPVQRMDLFRQVLDQLVALIDQSGLRPGDRLPSDRDLAAALHVSRPLVRQALKVLEGLGRVTAQQGSGTYVADNGIRVAANELMRGLEPGADMRGQLLVGRSLVDTQVMRDGYRDGGAPLIDALRRALDERRAELTEGPDEASLDLGFEAIFGHFCQNIVLRRLQAVLHDAWLETQIAGREQLPDRFALHHEHEAIFDRIEQGDIDGAVALFDAHLRGLEPGY
jgi:GntR family transcriptional repressor for pyruvate dehydrogenase complex